MYTHYKHCHRATAHLQLDILLLLLLLLLLLFVYHIIVTISDTVDSCFSMRIHTLGTGLFKLFKRPLPGFLTILTL